jgi:hypothetical protein
MNSKWIPGSDYAKLIVFYIIFNWFASFSKSILSIHFIDQGLSLNQLILGTTFCFAGVLFLSLLKISNKITSRLSWQLSLISIIIYVLATIRIYHPSQLYFASFINGFSVFFFFIFYNVAHFKNTPRGKTGHSSAIMFSIGPIVSIVAPLLAGFFAKTSFSLVWFFSIVFFAISIYFSRRQPIFSVKYSLKSALDEIRSTRFFIFLEGIWESIIFGVIPIYTLFFIKTPLNYSIYLAYLSLSAVVANLILGKISDRIQKRIAFLYPITIAMSIITFLFPFTTNNLTYWIIITGALQFLMPLFWNFSTAMVVDSHSNLELAMSGREIVLNSGRVLGLIFVFLSFILEKTPNGIFIFLGSLMMLFPICLFWRTKLRKNHSYL